MDIVKREPVAVANSAAAVVSALLICLIAFGVELTDEQIAGVVGVIIALGALGATVFGRARVTPVA